MQTTQLSRSEASAAAIFARIWDSPGEMSPGIARRVLKLRFTDEDAQRMHELAAKNQEGALSANEAEELDNYVQVGDLLAILQSKARKLLKRNRAGRHG